MVKNDRKISKNSRSNGWFSIEKNIKKYGEIKLLNKYTVTDVYWLATLCKTFSDKYTKLFQKVSLLGKYKNFLEISVSVE